MPSRRPRPLNRAASRRAIPQPQVRSKELNVGALPGFVRAVPSAASLVPLAEPVPTALYAVIGTWFEADVIEATVRNCLANGCAKVFVIDNDSPDATCAIAEAAGATIAEVYKTPFYDDDLRLRLMNGLMAKVTAAEKLPNLWWLYLDADEFVCGPGGVRLLDHLATLPPAFNVSGVRAVDLYPSVAPFYMSGLHPADCQALALHRQAGSCCPRGHWKHPLLRTVDGGVDFSLPRGSHTPYARRGPRTPSPVVAPHEALPAAVLFHAPFRSRAATEKRLEVLCGKRPELGGHGRDAGDNMATNRNGAIKRWRSLDAVYAGRWERVELPHCQQFGKNVVGIAPLPWRNLLPDVKTFPRWYPDPNVSTKVSLPLV